MAAPTSQDYCEHENKYTKCIKMSGTEQTLKRHTVVVVVATVFFLFFFLFSTDHLISEHKDYNLITPPCLSYSNKPSDFHILVAKKYTLNSC